MTSHPIYPVVVPGPEAVCSPSPGPERAHQWWPTRHRFSSHATQTCHALLLLPCCSVATDGCSGSVDRASSHRRPFLPSAPRLPAQGRPLRPNSNDETREPGGGDSNATAVQWSDGRASPKVLPAWAFSTRPVSSD